MLRKIAMLVIISATMCWPSGYAMSQGADSLQWAQEPTSFIGVKLRFGLYEQPLYKTECPKRKRYGGRIDYDDLEIATSGARCFKKYADDWATIENPLDIGLPGMRMTVQIVDHVVEGVEVTFSHSLFNNAVELFEAKYGKPHKSGRRQYRTGTGRDVDGMTSVWSGRDVEIVMSEYSTSLELSLIVLTTSKLRVQRGKGLKESLRERLDNL